MICLLSFFCIHDFRIGTILCCNIHSVFITLSKRPWSKPNFMNENYIQFLWKVKRLPFHKIKTTRNQSIQVKSTGIHNLNASGPDFLNGTLIIDEIQWIGNIEMHVKSSDWFLHNHHRDKAYDNVILHVVFEHDMDVAVNNEIIPTVELKNWIDWDHFNNWEKFAYSASDMNCQKMITDLDPVYIYSMMDRAIVDRLNRKSFFMQHGNGEMKPKEMLYFIFARAFGSKLNQLPFEEITHRLPLSLLKQFSRNKQKMLIEITSGLHFQTKHESPKRYANKLSFVEQHAWKRKGLRPAGFPEIRVRQFARFISIIDFDYAINNLTPFDFVEFIRENIVAMNREVTPDLQITNAFSSLLVVNALVPFLWWHAEIEENTISKDRVIDLLHNTRPESNWIIQKWTKLGIKPKSSYETQALIEIYNEFCTKNKCLSCQVGVKILSNT